MRRRVVPATLGLVLGAMTAVAVPGTASACSCAAADPSAVILSAAEIFVGRPVQQDVPEPVDGFSRSTDLVRWTLEVDVVHRGAVGRTVNVLSAADSASCGVPFVLGARYLVTSGGPSPDGRTIGLCGGTTTVDRVPPAVVAALGTGRAPDAVATGVRPPEVGWWTGPFLPALAVSSSLVLAVLCVRLRRR